MLLLIILFIIFLLHVQFLIRNYFFGLDEGEFFSFKIKYLFEHDIAGQSLIFSLGCLIGFSCGYLLIKKLYLNEEKYKNYKLLPPFLIQQNEIVFIVLMGAFQVLISLNLMLSSGFNYQTMAEYMEGHNFFFELRFLFLIPFSHLLLNLPFKDFIINKKLRLVTVMSILYLACVVLLQARSKLFEFLFIIVFAYLIKSQDKFKMKYLFFTVCAIILPNVIVLGRLGVPDDPQVLLNSLFSFEYSIIFNNALSAAIKQGFHFDKIFTFSDSLSLLIPSPIRDLIGIKVVKSSYYSDLALDAGLNNGGFSMLAEMFTNFGWLSPIVFFLFGSWLSYYIAKCKNHIGSLKMKYAIAPIIYAVFVLTFRNDFGVFIKVIVEVLVFSSVISFILKLRLHDKRS